MWIDLDLTEREWLEMEYQFVTVAALEVPEVLPYDYEILLYGFILHNPEEFESLCENLPAPLRSRLPCPLQYVGWAMLKFRDCRSGWIEVVPCQPRFPPGEIRPLLDAGGEPFRLSRKWNDGECMHGTRYALNCGIEHPFGSMRLRIWAAGRVTLSVEIGNFFYAEDVYDTPESMFDETRQRELQRLREVRNDGQQ